MGALGARAATGRRALHRAVRGNGARGGHVAQVLRAHHRVRH